jgi:hypothetical protein
MVGARDGRAQLGAGHTVDLFWRLVLIEIPITESMRTLRAFAMDYTTNTSDLDRVGLLHPSCAL